MKTLLLNETTLCFSFRLAGERVFVFLFTDFASEQYAFISYGDHTWDLKGAVAKSLVDQCLLQQVPANVATWERVTAVATMVGQLERGICKPLEPRTE